MASSRDRLATAKLTLHGSGAAEDSAGVVTIVAWASLAILAVLAILIAVMIKRRRRLTKSQEEQAITKALRGGIHMTTSQNESAGDMLHSLDEDKSGEPNSQLQMRFSRESAENSQS